MSWTLDDIDWSRFDPSKVDPEVARIVKAAALVESNGHIYAQYLCDVFQDNPPFQAEAQRWAVEEVRHGAVLAAWARLADPNWDFDAALARFIDAYRLPFHGEGSVRGSRSGELIARCIVETGTSSHYTAVMEATDEPVLREICRRIAADELRHYKLFYTYLPRYLDEERVGRWGRVRVAAGRLGESEDDELACAYWAANGDGAPYEHRRSRDAYARRAYRVLRPRHIDRAMAMTLKAAGLRPRGWLHRLLTRLAWTFIDLRARRLDRLAA